MVQITETIPADPNVEASLLGSLIISPDGYTAIADQLKKEYFSAYEHQLIFQAIKDLTIQKVQVDLVTLRSYLSKTNKLAEAGGTAYVVNLAENAFKFTNVAAYLDILREKHIKRAVINGLCCTANK